MTTVYSLTLSQGQHIIQQLSPLPNHIWQGEVVRQSLGALLPSIKIKESSPS